MIVQGNSFSLALPLRIYIVDDNQLVLEDYTPDPTDEVIVKLQGERRIYTYTPIIDENVATIALGGYELTGQYAVIVSIVKADGNRLKSHRYDQLVIVESIDELTHTEIIEGVEEDVIYLSPQAFIAGKDGRGIVSIEKTATAGLIDTYTITYTDDTTSTFEVTNGRDGRDGEDGQPGTPGSPGQPGSDGVGIVSITKTATSGLVDTYTILLTNGNTTTFQVTNGKDGETPDMSDYYTKGETNTLLGGKQDTLSNVSAADVNNESTLSRSINGKFIHDNLIATMVEVSATGDVSRALDSGKFYKFGSVDSLTLTLNAASVGMAGYFGKFTTSASWAGLSVPSGVTSSSASDTIAASKTYEFNIVDDVILVKEV